VALLFERNKVKFPRGDAYSRNMTDLMIAEFGSVAFTDKGKLEGVGEHDDTVMSTWLADLARKHLSAGVGIGFL
jgi:hypothetical protein